MWPHICVGPKSGPSSSLPPTPRCRLRLRLRLLLRRGGVAGALSAGVAGVGGNARLAASSGATIALGLSRSSLAGALRPSHACVGDGSRASSPLDATGGGDHGNVGVNSGPLGVSVGESGWGARGGRRGGGEGEGGRPHICVGPGRLAGRLSERLPGATSVQRSWPLEEDLANSGNCSTIAAAASECAAPAAPPLPVPVAESTTVMASLRGGGPKEPK